jgi:hypothetical protein
MASSVSSQPAIKLMSIQISSGVKEEHLRKRRSEKCPTPYDFKY